MLKPIWIVAFSGPRQDTTGDGSAEQIPDLREQIKQCLEKFRQEAISLGGDIEMFSGVSSKADLIAIEVAESMGLPVHLIVPLPILEFAEDFKRQPQIWDQVLSMVAKAGGLVDQEHKKVMALCKLGAPSNSTSDWPPAIRPGWTFRVADGTHERDDCYFDCDTQMLDAADALLAIASPEPSDRPGETNDLLQQAKARGIAIAKMDSSQSNSISGSAHIEWNSGPWKADSIVTDISSVNSGSRLPSKSSAPIEDIFSFLDEFASRTGGRLKNRVTTMIAFQFSATILTLIGTSLLLPKLPGDNLAYLFRRDAELIGYQIVTATAFVLLVWAFLLGLNSRWTDLKSQWRQTRFAAEVVRSLIHTARLVDPLQPIIARHNPAWSRFARSVALSAIRSRPPNEFDCEVIKRNYHRDRLQHQQEAYYHKQLASASQWSSVCGVVAFWTGAFAPFFLVLAMYLRSAHADWIATSAWSVIFIKLLPVLLPLLSGTATSLRIVTDAGRRAERYKIQVNRLQTINHWFPLLKTPSSIRRAVALTEEILLDELIEWYAASKSTGK